MVAIDSVDSGHPPPAPISRGLVRLLLSFALAVGLALPVPSSGLEQRHDSVAFTTTVIWLRAEPALDAKGLALLPQGTQVRVIECARQTCNVAFRQLEGYVPEEVLQRTPPAQPIDAGRGYINSQGQWIPSPTWTIDGQVPNGATAHCRDGSYSFSQSRRGTCSWHGGVADWL